MSRVGRKPISIIAGVKDQKTDHAVKVLGPKGQLSASVHPDIGFEVKDNQVLITRSSDLKEHRSLHGLWRALIANMIKGVPSARRPLLP